MATDFRELARQIALQAHIDPDIFVRQINKESGFDPTAYNKISGATGIAQIIPRWHPGVDPNDPQAALQYAANLMRGFIDKYVNYDSALRAYNAGPNGNWNNPETNDYVNAILNGSSGETNTPVVDNTGAITTNEGCAKVASTTVGMLLWLTLFLLDKIFLLAHLTLLLNHS
jgi:hypothetical protein